MRANRETHDCGTHDHTAFVRREANIGAPRMERASRRDVYTRRRALSLQILQVRLVGVSTCR